MRSLYLAFAILLFAVSSSSFGKQNGGGKLGAVASAPTAGATVRGGSGNTASRGYFDRRNPPPLDRSRKINEQDCSKPVDLTAGNLRCR